MKIWLCFPAPRGNKWVTADVTAEEKWGEQTQEHQEMRFVAVALNGKQISTNQ